MGFLGLFSGGLKLNKFANSVGQVIEKLDFYEQTGDSDYLLIAAWVCRIGIMDPLEKGTITPNGVVFVPLSSGLTKMRISEAIARSAGRLMTKVSNMCDTDQNVINEILERGRTFYNIDKQMDYETKKKYTS